MRRRVCNADHTDSQQVQCPYMCCVQSQIANSMDSLSSSRKDKLDNASELIGLEVLDSLLRDSFLKQLFSQFFEILCEATEPLPANLAVSSAHAIPLTVIIHTRLTVLQICVSIATEQHVILTDSRTYGYPIFV